jgi:hypothetical protein
MSVPRSGIVLLVPVGRLAEVVFDVRPFAVLVTVAVTSHCHHGKDS